MKRYLLILSFLALFGHELFAFQTTINIAVIRVDFQKDTNELTTGDGSFMIDTLTTTPFSIDPAPHNRTYFNDQMIAASNYFKTVSAGKMQIVARVFPQTMNGSYQLDHPMAFYNPNTSQDAIDTGVAHLFADALQVADADGQIDFSKYDLVIVFHAGVGRDVNLGIDETPQDIPSLYLTPHFIDSHLPEFSGGIPVNNGTVHVQQGIVLPETENQAGFSLALSGFIVSNIGSFIGLYDMFSATEQTPGIGRFGLMDVGLLNASGLIPSPPSAFSRQEMGWADIQRVSGAGSVSLRRQFTHGAGPDLVEIPVSEDESFLLEYRGDPLQNLDSLQFVLSDGREEFAGYMETLQTYFSDQIEISDSSGVLLKVTNYDLGLPGSGILLWHIDHSVVRRSKENGINNDPAHRGVDLEEADGSQDIGQQYSLLDAGFQSELGTPLDFWYKNNPAPLYKNEFSVNSTPSARSYAGRADLGISLINFTSNHDVTMSFELTRSGIINGYPYKIGTHGLRSSVLGKVQGGNRSMLFSVDSLGALILFPPPNENIGGQPLQLIFGSIAPAAHINLALGDVRDTNELNSLWAVAGDSLYAFDLSNLATTGHVDTLFAPIKLLQPSVSAVSVFNGTGYVSDGTNIYRVEKNGKTQIIPTTGYVGNLVPGVTDLQAQSKSVTYAAWAQTASGTGISVRYDINTNSFDVFKDGQAFHTFNADESPVGTFALADLDLNGTFEIIYNASKKLWAYNLTGALLTGFPFEPSLADSEKIVGTPAIVQITQSIDLFFTTNRGQLIGVSQTGSILNGFPRVSGGQVSDGPRYFPDQQAVGLLTNNGDIYLWKLDVPAGLKAVSLWNGAYGNPSNTARQEQAADIPLEKDELVPQNKFYNYPNPNSGSTTTIRYFLSADAQVTLRIFDPTGHKVREFSAPGFGNTTNELIWDVSDVASGVYACQLQAKSARGTERKIIKIMVVH